MPFPALLQVRPYYVLALTAVIVPALWFHGRGANRLRAPGRRFDDREGAKHIPPQEEYSPAPDPGVPPAFLEMGDPRATDSIVRDISATAEGAGWRWTYEKPTLKFHLTDRNRQTFAMDFTIVEMAFRSTGPVILTCLINDRVLARVVCPRPGNYHLEREVPAAWLAHDPVMVQASLDKVWTAPADGARLGYVLIRAGFAH